jgi:hypothetical protein
VKFAIAKANHGNEEYLRETHGDDCYTDDIGNAILLEFAVETADLQLQKGEYFVTVDDSDGLSVIDS